MAKVSRKGATSSHTIKAKGGCLQHNRRTQIPANVDTSRTHLNTTWEHDRIKNLKSTRSLIHRAEKLYTEKTKQKCQASFAPLKESCVVVKDSSTIEEAKEFASLVEQATGIRCLGIWFHKDEGHSRSKFRPDEPYQCNNHIHYLWDCQNPETGKAIPLKRSDMSLMQDLAAQAFGMERGIPASISGLKHLPSAEFKLQEVLKENEKLREENKELKKIRTGLLAKIQDAWQWKGRAKQAESDLEAERVRLTNEVNKREDIIDKLEKDVRREEKKAKTAERELSSTKAENESLQQTIKKLMKQPDTVMKETIIGDVLKFSEHPEYRDEWVATWRGYTVATARVKKDNTVEITEWHPDQESTSYTSAANINAAWRHIKNYTLTDFDNELKEMLGAGKGIHL